MFGILIQTIFFKLGDGIGPEISESVQKIFEAAGVPLGWESVDVTPVKSVWNILLNKVFFNEFLFSPMGNFEFLCELLNQLQEIELVLKDR